MSRHSRQLHVRLQRATAALLFGALAYRRWKLRPGDVICPPSSDRKESAPTSHDGSGTTSTAAAAAAPPAVSPSPLQMSTTRSAAWQRLRRQESAQVPFDVLIIGGGVTGLYAAVDAAQRGLSVALVESQDYGSDSETATVPLLQPGAFPYVQRAVRQRDLSWLRRAVAVMEEATIWCRVATHCTTPPYSWRRWCRSEGKEDGDDASCRTLIPALHRTEMAEYCAAAALSTVLSLWCGPPRPTAILSPAAVARRLPELSDEKMSTKGGVLSNDIKLDTSAAAISLVCTAERLGVTMLSYAPVEAIEDAVDTTAPFDAGAPSRNVDGLISAPPQRFVAHVRNALSSSSPDGAVAKAERCAVYTRSIINCTGSDADAVRALYSSQTREVLPRAYGGHQLYSYLVAPKDAVHVMVDRRSGDEESRRTTASGVSGSSNAAAAPGQVCQREPYTQQAFADALLLSSPRLSYASAMVLPWYDNCVLLGPHVSHMAPDHRRKDGAPPNSFSVQQSNILRTLRSCGIEVEGSRVMTCLSQVKPFFAPPSEAPFQAKVLHDGYAVELSMYDASAAYSVPSTDGGGGADTAQVVTRPFLHVYGGNAILARRIAEEAVDRLVRETTAISAEKIATLKPCQTRQLQLATPPSTQRLTRQADDAAGSTMERVQQLIEETHAERLVDVVSRRQHVLYTSPADAVQALPYLADIMARMYSWDARRQQNELAIAHAAVEAVAVRPLF